MRSEPGGRTSQAPQGSERSDAGKAIPLRGRYVAGRTLRRRCRLSGGRWLGTRWRRGGGVANVDDPVFLRVEDFEVVNQPPSGPSAWARTPPGPGNGGHGKPRHVHLQRLQKRAFESRAPSPACPSARTSPRASESRDTRPPRRGSSAADPDDSSPRAKSQHRVRVQARPIHRPRRVKVDAEKRKSGIGHRVDQIARQVTPGQVARSSSRRGRARCADRAAPLSCARRDQSRAPRTPRRAPRLQPGFAARRRCLAAPDIAATPWPGKTSPPPA